MNITTDYLSAYIVIMKCLYYNRSNKINADYRK